MYYKLLYCDWELIRLFLVDLCQSLPGTLNQSSCGKQTLTVHIVVLQVVSGVQGQLSLVSWKKGEEC